MKPCIIVHGGASNIADVFVDGYKRGTQDAAKAGYGVLIKVNIHIFCLFAWVSENSNSIGVGGSLIKFVCATQMGAFFDLKFCFCP